MTHLKASLRRRARLCATMAVVANAVACGGRGASDAQTSGGAPTQAEGGGAGEPAVASGGSAVSAGTSDDGGTRGEGGKTSSGGATGSRATGAETGVAGAPFCSGEAKVLYGDSILTPAVTQHLTPLARSCCTDYGVRLRTRETMGIDLLVEVYAPVGSVAPGLHALGDSLDGWVAHTRDDSEFSAAVAPAKGQVLVIGDRPGDDPWQLGVCITTDSAAANLGVGAVYVPPVAMDYEGSRERFAIWLLQDDSITASEATQLPLSGLALAPDPLITLDMVEYVEESTGWIALSPFRISTGALIDRLGNVSLAGKPFVATADGVRIYLGGFFSELSSIAIGNPEIIIDNIEAEGFKIEEPPYTATTVPDPRNDPRIIRVMKETARWVP